MLLNNFFLIGANPVHQSDVKCMIEVQAVFFLKVAQ
jgi:hypothetical protein